MKSTLGKGQSGSSKSPEIPLMFLAWRVRSPLRQERHLRNRAQQPWHMQGLGDIVLEVGWLGTEAALLMALRAQ